MSYSGTVKWFKGSYGFILTDEKVPGLNKDEVFVYYTGIAMDGYKKLYRGQEVDFDVVEGANGPQAVNVMVTKDVERDERGERDERDERDD